MHTFDIHHSTVTSIDLEINSHRYNHYENMPVQYTEIF